MRAHARDSYGMGTVRNRNFVFAMCVHKVCARDKERETGDLAEPNIGYASLIANDKDIIVEICHE